MAEFRRHAEAFGVQATIVLERDGAGAVRFLEHEGEHCPMLDGRTSACRIYEQRPARCRAFPEGPRPGCELSMLGVAELT